MLSALGLVREGRIFELARPRFPGMPNFPDHPAFQVLAYRTPRGLRVEGSERWTSANGSGSGYVSELIMGSAHTGAHIDALAHITAGPDDRWHGGGRAAEDLGDFGPVRGDAAALRPLWARGVLLDVAGFRGVPALPASEAIGAGELRGAAAAQGVEVRRGDVVLVRTGYMSAWPDEQALAAIRGAGPDLSAARWLTDRAVAATGSDTESYEVQPSPEASTPLPVHQHLLVEHGILIMESLDLEPLAAAGVHEFLFVALPVKIRGATGSMIDPIAVI